MACACKVTKYVNKIEKRYGKKTWDNNKTNISGLIKKAFSKVFFTVIILPLTLPIILFFLIRNCFNKKPISLDKIFKIG
jgi:hypothetical protein